MDNIRVSYRVKNRKRIILGCILVGILIALIIILGFSIGQRKSSESNSSVSLFKKAAVAAEIYECSKLGKEIIIDKNGSSVDAAIGTIFCNGVHNMQSSGIGGGGFMLIYDVPKGETEKVFAALDIREYAPGQWTQDLRKESVGPLSIAVPSLVKGLFEAHARFGKVEWSELVDPAVQFLKNGIKISKPLNIAILKKADQLKQSEAFRQLLMKEDGTFVKEGDIITDPLLAKTFETIRDNPQDFFSGEIAENIIKDLKNEGSIITLEDWTNYKAEWRDPIKVKLQSSGYTIHNVPPPTSGIIYQFLMRIFEGYEDLSYDTLMFQRLVESFKFGFAKKSFLGDPDIVNITDIMTKLRDEDYIKSIREKIDTFKTHDIPYYEPDMASVDTEDKGTTHISIIAPNGGAVALTVTINDYFGSLIRGSTTGIIFNNEMDDFTSRNVSNKQYYPQNNLIQPHKRPVSSMLPTIITDSNGKVKYVLGGSGGTKIISATMFVSMQSIFMNTELEKAIDNKRLYHRLSPNVLTYDDGFSKKILEKLAKRGHKVEPDANFSVIQAIQHICKDGEEKDESKYCLKAICDYRKHGVADGL